MADDKKKKSGKEMDLLGSSENCKNWEQRILSERESPQIWNNTWAPLFESDVSLFS